VVTATGSSANERYFVSDGGTAVIGWESATWTGPTAPFGFANASRRGLSFATQSHPAEIVSFGFWGDNFVDAQDTYTNHVHLVRVPWWSLFLATLLASLPLVLWRVRDRQRRWRLRRGLCVSCGYDLRGTPERCPECGTVPTSVKSAL
jgi:hypothetical protein